MSSSWVVPASKASQRTVNPIRAIVDTMTTQPNPALQKISFSIGDPTLFDNLRAPQHALELLAQRAVAATFNGYAHSAGTVEARRAIAQKGSFAGNITLTENDVVLASGGSGAIELAISVLLNDGDNMIAPCPGFPLYETIATNKGFTVKKYNLLADKNFEVDLEHLDKLIDDRTRVVVLNHPSNPCGAVYSREHLVAFLEVCERRRVPVLVDEIYEYMVFSGHVFHPLASLTTTVPILSVGGLAKRFMVPGWRVGWLRIYDRNDAFREVRPGLFKLSQLILGPNTLAMSVVPDLLLNTPEKYHEDNNAMLESNVKFMLTRLRAIDGLEPIAPGGAMYMLVRVDPTKFTGVTSDVSFAETLLAEQSVAVLPGACFGLPNFFRLVVTSPQEIIGEGLDRLAQFCDAHRVKA